MKAVVIGNLTMGYTDEVRAALKTPWTIVEMPDGAPGLAEALADADAALTTGWSAATPAAPKLKLLQVSGAGTDGIDFAAAPPGATICNAFGHEVAIGEYCILAMMTWCHEFHTLSRVLDGGLMNAKARADMVHHEEISGKTVGIIGLGRIGIAIAERAKALGCRVLGANRTPKASAPGVDQMIPWEDRARLFAESDFVAVTIGLSPDTKGLVDAAALAKMKPTGVIINVGRGAVIDEDALFAALSERRIGGAVIDVWWSYPNAAKPDAAPSKHPFHTLPNVLRTPHSSGWTTGMRRRRAGQIAANFDHLARGETLDHIVAAPRG